MSVKRQLERTRRQLLSAKRDAESLLAPGVLEEVFYRAYYPVADGFPPGSDGVGRGGTQTATERAALRLAAPSEEEVAAKIAKGGEAEVKPDTWTEREPDPVADALRELTNMAEHAQLYLRDAKQCRDYVVSVEQRRRGHESSADTCSLCEVVVTGVDEDRLKNLYCPACYKAWQRADYPHEHAERRKFEDERRKWLKRKEPKAC